ncbi:MAG: YiiX/YebB-like N1pC/P60 family cysteine hydrolase [Chlorobium sp.]|nr:YiiX/YebB-like N1pC/P60 family cysteine hydrolase [Chlorobium sp.]
MKKYPRTIITISSIVALYLILLIPLDNNPPTFAGNKTPFSWSRDSVWKSLELKFISSNVEGCDKIKFIVDSLFKNSELLLSEISSEALGPSNEKFIELEDNIFNLAPFIPVCTQYFSDNINFCSSLRQVVKEHSRHWDMNSTVAKNTLYKLLYGNRTAIEEIMLQLPEDNVPSLIKGVDETSETPSAEILGVIVHGGDILISRGGAPTSALIARGNDYPGNFSHIALVHIDEKTKFVSIIESHIERGVTISSLNEYLNDTKLRIMVLRLRSDLLKTNPMLPHLVAQFSLNKSTLKHIPYDFEMNINESERQFCSEVASSAYKEYGITLWTGLSTISSRGIRNWLAAFGVKNFETQEPSDLEYDPQLSVVAEWRDPATLFKDHLDNAVTDVMLEQADSGKALSYTWYALPIGRAMKLYSMILNLFGSEGPVPEGMSVEAALKNVNYSETHDQIKARLIILANQFKNESGYTPPYWELVNLARETRDEIKD